MTYREAKRAAAWLSSERAPITYRAKRQDWRPGNLWFCEGSDGSGVFAL